jgi:hypothetical protein
MQPTQRFKKTLLAGAVILGTGITFSASAANFPVTAGAVPDVAVTLVPGYTTLSFGSGIAGSVSKVGTTCTMQGKTGIADAVLLFDQNGDETNDAVNPAAFGLLGGTGLCIVSTDGTPVVLEIDAADASTVTVSVPDVVGTGFTYTPTAESCVVDYDRSTIADTCVSLLNNTVTGVGMSLTKASDGVAGIEDVATIYEFAAASGKTRMVLAGAITLDSAIAAGTPVTQNIIVQVTYE